jgi:hypothetical protein
MNRTLRLIALSAALILAPGASADGKAPERVAHHQGKQAAGLAEAVANLREANIRLAELLGGEVGEYDIHDIHSLSYTLEESLAKIRKDIEHLQEEVESMHFYSEGLKRDEVIRHGNAYLRGIGPLIKP